MELIFRSVFYKGYFVPVDSLSTDCPPTTKPTAATPAPTAAQSWAEAPAKIASKVKPLKNTDVEVFNSGGKTTTTAPKQENSDGDKQQPNINIEIHNVFSFGTNGSLPSRNDDTDSKIFLQTAQNHWNSLVKSYRKIVKSVNVSEQHTLAILKVIMPKLLCILDAQTDGPTDKFHKSFFKNHSMWHESNDWRHLQVKSAHLSSDIVKFGAICLCWSAVFFAHIHIPFSEISIIFFFCSNIFIEMQCKCSLCFVCGWENLLQ